LIILHIVHNFFVGGSQTLLVDIANEQYRRGDKVFLICINDQVSDYLVDKLNKGIKFICLRRKVGSKNPFFVVLLNFLLLKIRPNIIHAHNENVANFLFLFKKKSLLTVHDTVFNHNNIKYFDKLIAISEAVKKSIKQVLPERNVRIILNGVDIKNIKKIENKSKNSKPFKIIQVSRLVHEKKGQDLLIKAVAKINKNSTINLVTVDFVGAGFSENFLRGEVKKLNAGSFVKFLGELDRDKIYDSLCEYDLLVQPSLYEGFGLTVVEAAAAGLEILVSDIEGPSEIVDRLGFGEKFKCGSVDDLYEKIKLITDKKNTPINNDALCFFDIKRVVSDYNEAYNE